MRSLILIVGLALSSGCVTHRVVELDPPSQAAIADVGVEASGRSVWLRRVSGALAETTFCAQMGAAGAKDATTARSAYHAVRKGAPAMGAAAPARL